MYEIYTRFNCEDSIIVTIGFEVTISLTYLRALFVFLSGEEVQWEAVCVRSLFEPTTCHRGIHGALHFQLISHQLTRPEQSIL
jgi:hypothetical protein